MDLISVQKSLIIKLIGLTAVGATTTFSCIPIVSIMNFDELLGVIKFSVQYSPEISSKLINEVEGFKKSDEMENRSNAKGARKCKQ